MSRTNIKVNYRNKKYEIIVADGNDNLIYGFIVEDENQLETYLNWFSSECRYNYIRGFIGGIFSTLMFYLLVLRK